MGGIGTVVVVAKVPKAGGKSKTRLTPMLGEEGATTLATAMLMDVMSTVQQVECHKVVLYAPATNEARKELCDLLGRLSPADRGQKHAESSGRSNLSSPGVSHNDDITGQKQEESSRTGYHQWTLMVMQHTTLQDSNLSPALTAASKDIVTWLFPGTSNLVFVGMDAPELGPEQLRKALALKNGKAMLSPAQDGGYGLLGVSTTGGGRLDELFDGVLWSHNLTALSQIRAAQLAGFGSVRVGPVLRDVDVPDDVTGLCQRLTISSSEGAPMDPTETPAEADLGCLQGPPLPAGTSEVGGRCPHTRQALRLLGLLS